MTIEQRLVRRERSAHRWRFCAITLALVLAGRLLIGADFVPNEAKFDKVTTKQLVVVDGGDAWITLKADGPEASIGMLSAEHVGQQLMLHHAIFLGERVICETTASRDNLALFLQPSLTL